MLPFCQLLSFFFFSLYSNQAGPPFYLMALLAASLLLNVFAVSHISYYIRKHRHQDNTVYSIQLRTTANENDAEPRNLNHQPVGLRLNTRMYNQILFEVSTMVIFSSCLILGLIGIFSISIISKSSIIHYVAHFIDLLVMLIINLIFPCTFYVYNHNLRVYIKKLFVRA